MKQVIASQWYNGRVASVLEAQEKAMQADKTVIVTDRQVTNLDGPPDNVTTIERSKNGTRIVIESSHALPCDELLRKLRSSWDILTAASEKTMADASFLPGFERIYPGSHELRLLSLFQTESPLAPEGMLVVASLQKSPVPGDHQEAYTLEQRVELLSELAAAFSRQVERSRQALASIGHHS